MRVNTSISPELQHQAVKINLPDNLLWALDAVRKQAEDLTHGNANWLNEQIQKSKWYDLYGHDMSEFTGDFEALEKSWLELFNFRVDSTGWKLETKGEIQVKVNPEWDVWEYVSWVDKKIIWEQLFTRESAMREAEKCWKILPTKEQWEEICKPYNNGEKLSQDLWLVFAGSRDWTSGHYNNSFPNASYWSSSLYFTDAYYLQFSGQSITPANHNSRAYGFSVRCMKK